MSNRTFLLPVYIYVNNDELWIYEGDLVLY